MVKVAWKVINGYGPYAYLQESVKSGGKVTSNHIAYLGKAGLGKDGVVVIPGKSFNAPAAGNFAGGRILIPLVGEDAQAQLKPKPKALVEFMEQKAKAGMPVKHIVAGLQELGIKKGKGKVAPNKKGKKAPVSPGKTKVVEDQAAQAAKVGGSSKGPTSPSPPATAPTITNVPTNNKGKPLISKANVKKLEKAAAGGDVQAVWDLAGVLADKMLHQPKKAAIHNAAAELQGQMQGGAVLEGDGGSGLAETLDQVDEGKVKLPKQETPSREVIFQQEKAQKENKKNYDKDLEQVSGQKGSNEGGLFKDKHLDTLHYVKWPNGAARAKIEALTAMLYAYAKVSVPTVRAVRFQDKDAVMSDWIEDAQSMTISEMGKHKDVRDGFAVDAWLANWDVVGLQADNVVKGPGNKAYRIDLGGSMLFRAQGKPKNFPATVPELENMRNPGVAPQASKVFAKLTKAQLRASVKKVAAITDAQIDHAVDSVKLPKKSVEYHSAQFGPEANDLPKMLKARLKARRDWLVDKVLNAEAKKKATLAELQKVSDLKPASLKAIVGKAADYTPTTPPANSKWALAGQVMRNELGKEPGNKAQAQTKAHYSSWKGTTFSEKGSVLRWAAGAMTGEGRRELRRMRRFNEFLVKEKQLDKITAQHFAEKLDKATSSPTAADLIEGIKVANKENEVIHKMQNPGETKVTLYRGWKPHQVQYLKWKSAKVGDTLALEDPPLYSWSLSPTTAAGFGHGALVTRAEVPIDKIVLSDIANSVGKHAGENEVVFKGVDNLEAVVTKKY